MSSGLLVETQTDGVAVVTLNRADRLNALSADLARTLNATFTELQHDDAVRAVVIAGKGRAFCAGADITELDALDGPSRSRRSSRSSPMRSP
jgi:enoyl-CoA hydratase/carnithine racemase